MLSDIELHRVITVAEKIDPNTAAMVVLMVRCGLRFGEAIALRRGDIAFEKGTISLSYSMSRREGLRPLKGRSSPSEGRTIPMPLDVEERLRRHIADRKIANMSGFLFSSPAGQPIEYANWRRRVWSKITVAAGVAIVPHDLRRTAATRLFVVDRWVPPEVQAFLGHRDPRTTQRIYVRINPAELPRPAAFGGVR